MQSMVVLGESEKHEGNALYYEMFDVDYGQANCSLVLLCTARSDTHTRVWCGGGVNFFSLSF